MEEHLTKKERKEQSKLERLSKMEEKNNGSKTKGLVIAGIVLLFLAFFGYSIYAAKSSQEKKLSTVVSLSDKGWVKGNAKSKITFTEFGDFQCPACAAFEPIYAQMSKEYGKDIKVVFKHYPIKSIHPNAFASAVAAEAAGVQGKFWEFHDMLYAKQDEWSQLPDPTPTFLSYAKSLKIDTEKFEKDLGSSALKNKVNSQVDEGIKVGVNSTPSLFINGKPIAIPSSYEALKPQIEEAIKNSKSTKK